MLLWPETGPQGKWWYSRWSDEDAAKKVIGRSPREAINNCLENMEAAIVWDEELIRQRQEQASQPDETKAERTTICSQSEDLLSETAVAPKAIAVPEDQPKVLADFDKLGQSAELPDAEILPWWRRAGRWMMGQLGSRRTRKRLRVCETVSLGEKRFVAVIEVDGEQFLVGGASSSVATLARLQHAQDFSEVLKQRWSPDRVRA
jgi:hypothetical protein